MRALLAILALLLAPAVYAHKPSDSYLAIDAGPESLRGQWDIALRDLEYAIGLDADGDGAITWGELRAKHRDIEAYTLARLAVRAAGRPCALAVTERLVDEHSDGAYAVLRFDIRCEAVGPLELEYRLFAELDPSHRGLLRARLDAQTLTAVLGPEQPSLSLGGDARSGWAQLADYLREGVWHIWIGFDHVLFLLSLLLPAVFAASTSGWQPALRFGPVFWDVFRVVTAFTAAHSITLSLAALSVINLPSRLVESAIAFSVLLAALNNLRPVVHRGRWLVAFGFGLVHGFGFASVLADLGLPQDALLLALLGFNVGVEVGQLAIVGAFLPLAYGLRRSWMYRRMIFAGGSAAIAAAAALWMIERVFDVQLTLI